MGGTSIFAVETGVLFFILFGLLIGILFGFFGLGGSFFVTPALLVLNHPPEAAVGSGLVFVFGTSLSAVVSHRRLGHIDYKLGFLLILGMTIGIEVGKRGLFILVAQGIADLVISIIYVGLLLVVGLFVLRDASTNQPEEDGGVDESLIRRIGTIQCPPMVSFKGDVIASIWVVLVIAFVTGVLAGFLGVGGGFLVLPSLLYGLTLPEAIAVGTDIFQISVSSGYGAFLYAQSDAVHLSAVLPLLGGSVFGAYFGSQLTEFVDETKFKGIFAGMLLIDSAAVASKTVSHAYGIAFLHVLSLVLLFGTALFVTLIVVSFGTKNYLQNQQQVG
ncbi:sulfite exporter TauE/SafE family protein [Haladaptatus sp. DYF46]|uniref:sulfite exporter TauE/SafE family protein n=1 Tax=Haladaptatus sp. DYF46 TaxID=2886041 RepID=UPI001E5EAF2B|nr:sulfite exporter TauE/SafE family protein [Haladaptatus sp. DYF46]